MRTISSSTTELSVSSNVSSNMSGRCRRVSTTVRFSLGATVGNRSIELTEHGRDDRSREVGEVGDQ